jgi:S1-C subfamily serine protease
MKNVTQVIALSAATSLVVSSLVLAAGGHYLPISASSQSSSAPAQQNGSANTNDLDHQSAIENVVQKTQSAVVSVTISKDVPVIERSFQTVPFGNGFNINIPQIQQKGTQLQEVGGGTAFFVSADGLLLTNKHVVSDTNAKYTVLLNDGRTLDATVVARDAVNDIALLKVNGSNFPYLQLSSNDQPVLGQTVVAIGNALAEFRNTVSVGVVSGLQRTITAGNPSEGSVERLSRIIQTDAAINEGNSGGPLLDINGEVLGMNTAVASDAQNIGFAIPVGDIRRAVESYQQYGHIVRPYLGVRYVLLTPDIAKQENISYTYGVLVAKGQNDNEPAIVAGSPAASADIKEGDVILEAEGTKLTEETTLSDIIQQMKPGDTLHLHIARAGKERDVTVVLQEWKQ